MGRVIANREETKRLRTFRLSLKERCPKCTYVPFAGETQYVKHIPQPIVERVHGRPVIGEKPTQKLQLECKRCGYSWSINSYDYVEDEEER